MPTNEASYEVTFNKIAGMATENKGAFGEQLAGIWLKEKLKSSPSLVADKEIPDSEPRMWFSHLGVHRCTYGEVNDDGVAEKSWEPDYSFKFTLPDHDVRKEILIEAKTGAVR